MVISCGCSDVDETPLEDIDQDAAAVEDPVGAIQQHLQQQYVAQQGQQEQPQLLGQEQPQLLGQEQQQQQDGFVALKQQMLEPQQQLQRELQQGAQQAAAERGSSSSSSSTRSNSSTSSPAVKVNPQQLPVVGGRSRESLAQRSKGSSSSVRAISGSTDLRGSAAAGSSNSALADGGCSVMSWDLDESSSSGSSSSSSDLLPSKGMFDRLQGIR
jgi:hypothetical protein